MAAPALACYFAHSRKRLLEGRLRSRAISCVQWRTRWARSLWRVRSSIAVGAPQQPKAKPPMTQASFTPTPHQPVWSFRF